MEVKKCKKFEKRGHGKFIFEIACALESGAPALAFYYTTIRTRKNSVFGHFSRRDIPILFVITISHPMKNSNSSLSIHLSNLQSLANSSESRIILQFKEYAYITLWVKSVKLSRTKNMGNGSK